MVLTCSAYNFFTTQITCGYVKMKFIINENDVISFIDSRLIVKKLYTYHYPKNIFIYHLIVKPYSFTIMKSYHKLSHFIITKYMVSALKPQASSSPHLCYCVILYIDGKTEYIQLNQ